MELVRQAKAYKDTIHFEIGEPDLPPSPRVKEALKEAIDLDRFSYTESLGLYELRELIAKHYLFYYGVNIDANQILITPGTSIAFMVVYELLLGSGDNLALSDPSYPCYKNFATMVDANSISFRVDASTAYQITPDMLKGANLKALHISSPSNPVGTLYTPKNLEALAKYCKDNGITLISDELYHGLTYETKASSALEFSKDAIVINGFSKYFCMPGFRLGWIVLPKALVRQAEIIAQNLFISAPTFSQYSALSAFDYEYLEEVREEFKRRRDWLYSELSQIFEIDAKPEGAFYIWCDISKYSSDAISFSQKLLKDIHLAVTPGIDFGEYKTATKLRFAYTKEIEHMREGIKRLKRYLGV